MNPTLPVKLPGYSDILKSILASSNGPLSVEELADELLTRHPSIAKNPHQAALAKIRDEEGRQLVYLDANHVLPLRLAYQGDRYRIRLTREQANRAALPLRECFQSYLPLKSDWESVLFFDSQDTPIPSHVMEAPHEITFSSDEKVEYTEPVVVLKEWFHSQKMYFKDHILVTIVNWEKGVVRLERERFGEQHADLVAERNRLLADQLFAMLEAARYEDIDIQVALPTIYARLPDKQGVPPDHWAVIVENDPRMKTNGWDIHYSDSRPSPLEKITAEATSQRRASLTPPFPKEEGQKVYRWRAELLHSPSIWREIEILGRQSLTEIDSILRDAFEHDTWDHLSGFWKLVARGGGPRKHYREVEIGDVNPFEPTAEEHTAIAALKLNVGDQLKYVYDFGDWIEHTLELKSIGEAEKDVRYPRQVARNKPKYENCMECQKKGKQTIATQICITCSNEMGNDVLLCENCMNEHNEDHYTEEILY
jgi:hypothetical protein